MAISLLGKAFRLKNSVFLAAVFLFFAFGAGLIAYTNPSKLFQQTTLIYDLIWLDAWAVTFLVVLIIIWNAPHDSRYKYPFMIFCLMYYGLVSVNLFFDGTPFALNAYWGDQKFRIAMVEKFISFGVPTDFYYKDLPPFYPPLYYYLLSVYARLFSIEAYKMLKIGSMLVFFFGPPLFYYAWKKIVSPVQALFITVIGFLYCNYGHHYQFYSPPGFLASLFFIPWWLYYIERVKNAKTGWKYYLGGGCFGALIFMTYFYPLVIGGLLLILRLTVFRGWKFVRESIYFKSFAAIKVFVLTLVFSAVYWLPPLISVIEYGWDRSRGGWHHIGTPGFNYQYLLFSFPGIFLILALVYLARRWFPPLNRGLLYLAGTPIVLHLLGSILGGLGKSVNISKGMHFIEMTGGIYVGLFLAQAVRLGRRARKFGIIIALSTVLILLVLLNNFNGLLKQPIARKARETEIPSWVLHDEERAELKGSIALMSSDEFTVFHPVYTFIAGNEHFSHPASRFKERFDFLYRLQEIRDPYLFYLALRHNIFDPVDYFMLRKNKDYYDMTVSLSNYPDRLYPKVLKYNRSVIADTSLFEKKTQRDLYRLLVPPIILRARTYAFDNYNTRDSLIFLYIGEQIKQNLESRGKQLLDKYMRVDWSRWSDIEIKGNQFAFDDRIILTDGSLVNTEDSTYFFFTFMARTDMDRNYKIFLHLYDTNKEYYNFDFWPKMKTSAWKKWDLISCCRVIPRMEGEFNFLMGFFKDDERLGDKFAGRYVVSSTK